MTIKKGKELLQSKWLREAGPDAEIVISSRIRLARNFEAIPFPSVFNSENAGTILKEMENFTEKSKGTGLKLDFKKIADMDPIDREILVEKHLISPQQVNNLKVGAVVLNQDESLSIMINEEDHLRIQCLLPGLNLNKAWEYANYVDDFLEESVTYAFSEDIGYLTACPTNVGTGLRASVMVHLPGLVITNQISRVLSYISQLGLTVRGFYGEGTDANGNLFQISNQVTLGQSEEEIIGNLTAVIEQIKTKEKMARATIYRDKRNWLEDKVFRSLGMIKYARTMSSTEALNLLSYIRLGISLDIIKEISLDTLKELMILTRPALLAKIFEGEITENTLDILRTEINREVLNS